MKKPELEKLIKGFDLKGKTTEDLNVLRSEIFNSLDAGDIRTGTKNSLLKDLYRSANIKGIFFIPVVERTTQDLPKNQQEQEALEEENDDDESYEESYEESYDEDEEEEP